MANVVKGVYKHPRYTKEEWESNGVILGEGVIGIETDTNQIKIGNGESTWSELAYVHSTDEIIEQLNTKADKDHTHSEYLTSTDLNGLATLSYVDDKFNSLNLLSQNNTGSTGELVYTAGHNITITEDNIIHAENTVYDDTEIKTDIDYLKNNQVEIVVSDTPPENKNAIWVTDTTEEDKAMVLGDDVVRVVEHGTDPSVERPIAKVVVWLGSVNPINSQEHDVWIGGE